MGSPLRALLVSTELPIVKDDFVMLEVDRISIETAKALYVHIRLGKRQWVVAERWIPKSLAEPRETFKASEERVRMYIPNWLYRKLGFRIGS